VIHCIGRFSVKACNRAVDWDSPRLPLVSKIVDCATSIYKHVAHFLQLHKRLSAASSAGAQATVFLQQLEPEEAGSCMFQSSYVTANPLYPKCACAISWDVDTNACGREDQLFIKGRMCPVRARQWCSRDGKCRQMQQGPNSSARNCFMPHQ
jgi:hypothetical protein